MSMLEDTQSAGDGYKTPNSLAFKETFAGEISDQLASAVLRLQHGLDETITRLDSIEDKLNHSINRINMLEKRQSKVSLRRNNLLATLRNMKTVHWFYLGYPILVYLIIGALKRRDRSRAINISSR